MRKIKLFTAITLLSSMIATTSCSDWLNVKPSNQTEASILLSSERGFQECMIGVLTMISAQELYGREMTFGVADILGGVWGDVTKTSKYYGIQRYNFDDKTSTDLYDKIWESQFTAIAQINNMLKYVDINKNVFSTKQNYAMIKGEALGLRAFLHFDLLRLFAPYDVLNPTQDKWLPYVDEFTKNTSLSITFKDYIKMVKKDIEEALNLLQEDDIFTGTINDDLYYENRQYHFNYYAVQALQARVLLYCNEKTEALRIAKDIIAVQQNKSLFSFVTEQNATMKEEAHMDRTFSTEHIFALNVTNMQDNIETYFYKVSAENKLTPLTGSATIYEGFSEYRSQFFKNESGVGDVPSKFWQLRSTNSKLKQYQERLPLIRITEMYYIAAECVDNTHEAEEFLNTVRRGRGITAQLTNLSADNVRKEIMKEYQKEFLGEGQMFFYHKRFGTLKAGKYTTKYVIPIPQIEIEFGNRPSITKKKIN